MKISMKFWQSLLIIAIFRLSSICHIQNIHPKVCHVNDCASTATCRSDSTATYGYKCVCNNIVLADTIKVTKHEKSSIETLECPCSFKKKDDILNSVNTVTFFVNGFESPVGTHFVSVQNLHFKILFGLKQPDFEVVSISHSCK